MTSAQYVAAWMQAAGWSGEYQASLLLPAVLVACSVLRFMAQLSKGLIGGDGER